MAKMSIVFHYVATRFLVAVRVQSIQRASSITAARHLDSSVARVKFSVEAEGVFVELPAAWAEPIEVPAYQ